MSQPNDYKDKDNQDDDSGSGGQDGQIEFKAFIALGETLRDDLLTGEERRRLLIVHESAHEASVSKQKDTRDQYKAVKAGKVTLAAFREGLGRSAGEHRHHPILSDKAQFSGSTDKQVNPTDNMDKANDDKKNELQYQYNLTHRLEAAPKFNPRPIHK